MTTINFTAANSAENARGLSFSPRVARVGVALIAAAVAILGVVSVAFGSNDDSSRPVAPTIVSVR